MCEGIGCAMKGWSTDATAKVGDGLLLLGVNVLVRV